jgi:hypothetical protein
MTRRLLLACLAAALTLTACGGGGGGGGGGPTEPPPPQAGLTYTPAPVSGPNTITLRRVGTGDDRLVLELFANQVSGVYGVAFDLRYPTNVLVFDSVREESFLSAGGSATTLQIAEAPAGNLVVGITRLGRVSGVDGSGVLLTLELRVVGNGSGTLSFTGNEVFDSAGDPMPGLTWGAGSVTANP